jgi:diacylglycerol kinase family enzyme
VAFVLALRALLRRYLRLRMRVHLGREEALEQVTPFLFVGNNRYQTSGLRLGPRSQLDAGRLWVCTAPSHGRENILGVALKTLMGRETEQGLNIFEAEELSADPGSTRVNVSTDGEVSIMDAPLHYRIRPRALGIVTPANIPSASGGGAQTGSPRSG